jgi:hypothetical protein
MVKIIRMLFNILHIQEEIAKGQAGLGPPAD